MRFMLLMIPGEAAEKGDLAPPEFFAEMMKFNKALADAGALVSLDGLHPTSSGARVSFRDGGKPVVTDGPFTETKEVIGGYWMINVASRDEAIAWASKCPNLGTEIIEIRQVYELEEFPEPIVDAVKEDADAVTEKLNQAKG